MLAAKARVTIPRGLILCLLAVACGSGDDRGDAAALPGGHAASSANPVLVLPCEDGAGTTATDVSGRQNHASLTGSAAWGQGGVVLSGSGAYLQVAPAPTLDLTTALTIAAWVKGDSFDTWDGIVTKGLTRSSYAFQLGSSRRLRFTVDAGTSNVAWWTSNAALTIGRWHHVAVTWDGAKLRFFLDGVRDTNEPTLQRTLATVAEPLTIGGDLPGSDEFFDGAIRDVRMYDAALTDTEVAALANGPAPRAIGAFLNGMLPARTPGTAIGYTIVPAFPALRFDDPLVIRSAPNSNRLWVGSRQGVIHSFTNAPTVTQKDLFLDLSARCAEVWDGGFLGLAFHPEFGVPSSPNRGYFYVYYCYTPDGNYPKTSTSGFFNCYLRLSRFSVQDGSLAADPGSEAVMIHLRLYNGSHRSGDIAFGPDGFLYVPIGDQFRYETAQTLDDNLEGGIARIDVDRDPARSHPPRRTMPLGFPEEISGQHYWIPNDNPFLDPAGGIFEEWFSIGHRNPHRMTIDRLTGRIWSGEVGGSKREEINVIEKGGNYGWPFREGLIAGPRSRPPTVYGAVTDPVLDFERTEANAIVGGYVYRGSQFPSLYGKYLCVDHRQDRMWALTYDPVTRSATKELLTTFAPQLATTFGEDAAGNLYIGSLHDNDTLYRLAPGANTGQPPALLSQTGVFANLRTLEPNPGIVPYGLNAPFWSDSAYKARWIALQNDGAHDSDAETIVFEPDRDWTFPIGTVLVKHFELGIDDRDPSRRRRLETRLLVRGDDGVWYGVTYRWHPDGSDAALLSTGLAEDIAITTATGSRVQRWTYPSREDCLVCHAAATGAVLGVRTHQLNGSFEYPAGHTENQLRVWNRLGWFRAPLPASSIPSLPASAPIDDLTHPVEDRARAWLDSNCASCHRPDSGNRAQFDARLTTPFAAQGLLRGPVLDDLGVPGATLLTPHDPAASIAWLRLASLGAAAMPPLAKGLLHEPGIELTRQWIFGLAADARWVALGHPINSLPSLDTAWHTMLVDEERTYSNTTGLPEAVRIGAFRFYAAAANGPVTPFVVKVHGDDSFTVAAIGTSRTAADYRLGANVFPFAEGGDPTVVLLAGETLAAGFLDAFADGSGGANGGVVPYCVCDGDNELWYTGGPNAGDSGRVVAGSAPIPGAQIQSLQRIYAFAVDFCNCSPPARGRIGNAVGDQIGEDAWTSNLVVDDAASWVNDTGQPQRIALESFAFWAKRQADPVTPFVVRANGTGDYTVIAIGTTRAVPEYAAGHNRFAFDRAGPQIVTLAPGERVAPGFLDAAADGSGGGSGAVIPFAAGSGSAWHTGGATGSDSGSIAIGQPPQAGASGPVMQARAYSFSIRFRAGPPGTPLALGSTIADRADIDPWSAHLAVDESHTHTNAGAAPQVVEATRFRFWARGPSSPLTPFLVKVRGPDDFQVVAIGTTRTPADYAAGSNSFPFLEGGPIELVLAPGETIAPGFLAAWPDGGGAAPAPIPWDEGGRIWWTGGPSAADSGRIEYGLRPWRGRHVLPGTRSSTGTGAGTVPLSMLRDYAFAIDLDLR